SRLRRVVPRMSLGRCTTLCLQESCQSYVLNISGLTGFCPVKQQSHEGTNRERVTRRACSGVERALYLQIGCTTEAFFVRAVVCNGQSLMRKRRGGIRARAPRAPRGRPPPPATR